MSNSHTSLRIVHLSDPHFSTITWNPTQFLSKRWIGNWNLLLFRRKEYSTEALNQIPEIVENLDVNAVIISGDFVSTALKSEFEKARGWIDLFAHKNIPLFLVPGNHDYYTREAERLKLYYQYFPSSYLERDRVEKREIKKGWWWVGLDSALATPPFYSYGRFTRKQGENLITTLKSIDIEDRVILANHFPLFSSGHPRHDLENTDLLQAIVQEFPQIKLYLHGHEHRYQVLNERGFPLVINSGSCARIHEGTFHVVEIEENFCHITRYALHPNRQWERVHKQTYILR